MLIVTDRKLYFPEDQSHLSEADKYVEMKYKDFINEVGSDEGLEYNFNVAIDIENIKNEDKSLVDALFEIDLIYLFYLDSKEIENIDIGYAKGRIVNLEEYSKPKLQKVYVEEDISKKVDPQQKQEEKQQIYNEEKEVKKEVVESKPEEKTIENNYINEENSPSGILSELLEDSLTATESEIKHQKSGKARSILFGSSKGGAGKTFTSILSTYHFAKKNPSLKIAFLDFDVLDGQVGILIKKFKPTLKDYFQNWLSGMSDINTMRRFSLKGPHIFPQNVDFYLHPSNSLELLEEDKNGKMKYHDFWKSIIDNAINNYDVVVFDTGIDYISTKPIVMAYKAADKINLITSSSIKSVNSVAAQIEKLKGVIPNKAYKKEDNMHNKINLIITQLLSNNNINNAIKKEIEGRANLIAEFPHLDDQISEIEWFGYWNIFDQDENIQKQLESIME